MYFKTHKFRNTYDKAAEHVYLLLLKKDCYPRFIRSDHYKALLTNAINPGSSRKRIFNFPQIRKKASTNQPPHAEGAQAHGGGFVSAGELYFGNILQQEEVFQAPSQSYKVHTEFWEKRFGDKAERELTEQHEDLSQKDEDWFFVDNISLSPWRSQKPYFYKTSSLVTLYVKQLLKAFWTLF